MAHLYSNMKFLGYADHIESLRNKSVLAPVHIRIKPKNHCNHNCWYCAYRYDNLQLGEDMAETDEIPADKMDEIVSDIIDMGVKAVTFSGGGEPLLYKPLPKAVERLSKAGIKVATLTNGSNLKGKYAEVFAKYATWVRVSVDAWDDDSYSLSRGVKHGAYSNLLNNMRNFIATGTDCVLGVSLIIDKTNCEHLYDFCAEMKDVGVDHIKLSPVVVGNDVAENNIYHGEIKDIVTAGIKKAKKLETDSFKLVDHYHDLPDLFAKSYSICPFLQFLTVIGGDSAVYTCQDKAFTESGFMGSLENQSFKEFWYSEENRKHLYSFNPKESCQHHCVTHAKNVAIIDYLSIDQDHANFV
jgi:MoaA/NifB/PqqE/SkfB family radical SAM enzyme